MLTQWPPMTNLLFLIVKIYQNQFKCKLSQKQKTFSELLSAFLKNTSYFQHAEKRWALELAYFGLVDKYSLHNSENLSQLSQKELCHKEKTFRSFLLNFWKLCHIFNMLKKDDPHSLCISEIRDYKRPG